ncbi:MAG: transglutaminase domain-containing protein [Actinomycetota bacterium]
MSQIIEDPRTELEDAQAAPTPDTHADSGGEAERKVRQASELIEEEEDRPLTREEIMRPSFGALSTTLGAAFLVGGMFVGALPRFYAVFGALVGVGAAMFAARPSKRPGVSQLIAFGAILACGLVALAITSPGALGSIGETLGKAVSNARQRRPPAVFDDGWKAILPWTLAMLGFAAAWVGSVGRKPAMGVLVPMPVIAFAAIAQPSDAQIASGIVAFITFVVGLAVIYRADRGEGDGVSVAYEIRRAVRMLPLLAALTAALVAVSQAGFLFPDPIFDPTERAQRPKSIPLSEIEDRVLFTAETPPDAPFTGPWRTGVLDVIDPEGWWRLPPFNAAGQRAAPRDGLVGRPFGHEGPSQSIVTINVQGLDGTVLPMPARVQAIRVTKGPKLDLEVRTQRVLVREGQVGDGLAYQASFSFLPTEQELRNAPAPTDPAFFEEFTSTAELEPPESAAALIATARQDYDNTWDQLDYIREEYLGMITAAGAGLPSPVPPEKIEDMFSGTREATPFEIVATQAMFARWLGVPARIGYGFDVGEASAAAQTLREYRPKHGASWLEVYFEGIGWFPVTGLPKKARQSLTGDASQDSIILPSDDIAVNLFVPQRDEPTNYLLRQAQAYILLAMPFILAAILAYFAYPVILKARRRSKRKEWALRQGRSERIAVAYADMRDLATDLGVGDPYGTPLAYTRKVVPDEEHQELAWLVTRTLFGDLRGRITDDEVLAAEELSRSLRRRLSEAQPFTIRAVAYVSRLSLRNPYAPELLSPPVPKFEWRKFLPKRRKRGTKIRYGNRIRLRLPSFPRRKGKQDEVVA